MAVTFNKQEWREEDGTLQLYGSGVCLSTDTKPVDGIINGSSLIEMDTKKVYFLDKPARQWREF